MLLSAPPPRWTVEHMSPSAREEGGLHSLPKPQARSFKQHHAQMLVCVFWSLDMDVQLHPENPVGTDLVTRTGVASLQNSYTSRVQTVWVRPLDLRRERERVSRTILSPAQGHCLHRGRDSNRKGQEEQMLGKPRWEKGKIYSAPGQCEVILRMTILAIPIWGHGSAWEAL